MDTDKILLIGEPHDGATISAKAVIERAGKDVIVIDNISEMLKEGMSLEEMVEKQRGITMEIKNPYPLATVEEYTDIIGPYHKKRKPNSGLKIGSYRYKGK